MHLFNCNLLFVLTRPKDYFCSYDYKYFKFSYYFLYNSAAYPCKKVPQSTAVIVQIYCGNSAVVDVHAVNLVVILQYVQLCTYGERHHLLGCHHLRRHRLLLRHAVQLRPEPEPYGLRRDRPLPGGAPFASRTSRSASSLLFDALSEVSALHMAPCCLGWSCVRHSEYCPLINTPHCPLFNTYCPLINTPL